MRVLALDTATGILSAALSSEGGLWYAEADAGMRHSELLMDMAEDLLRRAGTGPEDLEGVLCMEGPGSFTGLRIGFAAAKGLALGRNIPWAAVPTLDCMALPHSSWPGPVLPAIDAKKRSFFTALYRGGERISAYLDAEAATAAGILTKALEAGNPGPVLLTGPEGELFAEKLRRELPADLAALLRVDSAGRRGRARELLEIAEKTGLLAGGGNPGESPRGPLYLRKSDAELTLGGQAHGNIQVE